MFAHVPWVWDWTAAGWAAAAAWATFAVAAVAAVFAGHQVLEARRTREEQAQPFVVVDFEPSRATRIFMDLVIRNTGATIAKGVKLVFDPLLASTLDERDGTDRLAGSAIIAQGIPTLPPGREYRVLFEYMPDRMASDLPRSYDLTVFFHDTRGRNHELEYRLDLDMYFGVMQVEIYGEHDAAKALREIEKTIRKWSHVGGIRVWTRDEDAYLDRVRAEHERDTAEGAAVDAEGERPS